MSQPKKKKVVVTTGKKTSPAQAKKEKEKGTAKAKPRPRAKVSSKTSKEPTTSGELIFSRQNYILMGIGVVVIIFGLMLMTGGAMDSPDEWDADRIYSFRRTVLGPFFILAGLIVEIVAIFRR